MDATTNDKKLNFKNYLGYAVADLGNNIAFSAISAYLMLYYTDVLGANLSTDNYAVWLNAITIIMIVARVWDGINDPIMGFVIQGLKPTKWGKFRPFLLIGGIPLSIVALLCFLPVQINSLVGCISFALISYILYGMIYTIVLVPYGSMATVMTRDNCERSSLSICRSIGGGIGGIPAGIVFPLVIYTTVIAADGTKTETLNGKALFVCMAVIALVMVLSYIASFFCTKENYPYPNAKQKLNLRATFKSLLHNKPFIIISLAGMLLIACSMYIGSINIYLFNVYYLKNGFMTFVTIATYLPMIVFIPFVNKIIKKVGKKEMCIHGLILSTAASLIMWLWKMPNPWIYIAFCFLQGAGIGFFTLEIWAMAMDVIDYQELLTKRREEASSYAIFTFMRKIGQAIAAIVPSLLAWAGYDGKFSYVQQGEGVALNIYNLATIVPFILFALMLILMIIYPLGKKNDAKMREDLAEVRRQYEIDEESIQPQAVN